MVSLRLKQLDDSPYVEGTVPVVNNSGATYARARGKRWVRKTRAAIWNNGILAEALGWYFCRRLGISVPDVAVYLSGAPREDCWLSEVIPNVAHWSATRVPVQNIDELGEILAVDAILGNADRHGGNILLQPMVDETGEGWKFWGIDFGNAIVGDIETFAQMGMEIPEIDRLPDDLPFEILEDPAREMAQEIAQLDERFISSSVTDACSLIETESSAVLEESLKTRCENADVLIDNYFDHLLEES